NDLTHSFTRYMDRIPPVKVTHPGSMGGTTLSGSSTVVSVVAENAPYATIATNTDGWKYNRNTGDLWVNNSQTDSKSIAYSMYGYD
ncbi:MAG TPA: hypothetical protein P5511_03690, partial [Candidatus Goldiibacteriota bacterium]|nr:hypothetical protein [Candidatus Goldiibacteriota bacterium]